MHFGDMLASLPPGYSFQDILPALWAKTINHRFIPQLRGVPEAKHGGTDPVNEENAFLAGYDNTYRRILEQGAKSFLALFQSIIRLSAFDFSNVFQFHNPTAQVVELINESFPGHCRYIHYSASPGKTHPVFSELTPLSAKHFWRGLKQA
jgi:hypothetical protein